MSGAATFFSLITGLVVIGAGGFDFTDPPKTVQIMRRLGYRYGFHRFLGLIKILGGLGLLIGLAITPIGILAALGLCVYFVLAVRAHARLGDPGQESIPAAALFMLSALSLLTIILS